MILHVFVQMKAKCTLSQWVIVCDFYNMDEKYGVAQRNFDLKF